VEGAVEGVGVVEGIGMGMGVGRGGVEEQVEGRGGVEFFKATPPIRTGEALAAAAN
jgi:hypothetical protein